jgi:hypothetical protein
MILPGSYSIRLTVDGKTLTQPLVVEKDPRSKNTGADLQAQFTFYRDAVHLSEANLERYKKEKKENKDQPSNFVKAMELLTSMIRDLEDSDGPPTQPQRTILEEIKNDVARTSRP